MKHNVIYVPGLGDPRYPQQGWALKAWDHLYGIRTHYLPLIWGDGEVFQPKFQRLLADIDELATSTSQLSLIGVSAGASAVLNAFAERPDAIDKVVCICGKINNPQTISRATLEHNPVFGESITLLQANLPRLDSVQRARIMSIHPLRDGVVPPKDTIIDGAHEKVIPSIGHVASIGYCLTAGSYDIVKFLKA